ncbi:hypothetical protein N7490_008314 [Penicillium lividum]|nr:hypothetical protein N7490_008314 [Penicillium lividum]
MGNSPKLSRATQGPSRKHIDTSDSKVTTACANIVAATDAVLLAASRAVVVRHESSIKQKEYCSRIVPEKDAMGVSLPEEASEKTHCTCRATPELHQSRARNK